MKVGEAWLEMRVKSDQAEKDVASAGRKLTGQLLGLFSTAAFLGGMKKAVNAASDLNEEITKSQTIFGKSAGEVEKFAKTAATAMGISERAYLSAASNLKGMLDNMGLADAKSTEWSQKLVALGGDLASFFNTQPADAIQAISASLRGEQEPIRRYNVSLNDALLRNKALELGLYDGKGALDANARANAALAVIMEQTSAAQGDFARTSSGLANTQRITAAQTENAAASLGKSFLPIYQRISAVVGSLAEGFGHLNPHIQIAIVALVGLAAMAGPISSLIALAGTLRDAIVGIAAGASAALPWLLLLSAAVLTAIGLWEAFHPGPVKANKAVVALTKSLQDSAKTLDAQKIALQSGAAAAKEYAKVLFKDADAGRAETIRKDKDLVNGLLAYGISMEDATKASRDQNELARQRLLILKMDTDGTAVLTGAMKLQGITQEDVNRGTKAYRELIITTAGDFPAVIDGLVKLSLAGDAVSIMALKASGSWDRLTWSQQLAANAVLKHIEATDKAAGAAGKMAATTIQVASAQDVAKAASADLDKALQEVTGNFLDASGAADSLRKAIDDVFAPSKDMEAAIVGMATASDALVKSFKDNGKTLDVNTEKGRANRKVLQDSADAIINYGVAVVEQGGSLKDANNIIAWNTELLIQQAMKTGLSRDAATEYLKTIGLTPKNVETAISIAGDNVAKAKLKDMLDQLGDIDSGAKAEITADINNGDLAAAERKLQSFINAKRASINLNVTASGKFEVRPSGSGRFINLIPLATGGFIPYGTGPDGTTPALLHPNEAVIPLSNPSRIQQLFSDSRIADPIQAALSNNIDPYAGQSGTPMDPYNWAGIDTATQIKQQRDALFAAHDKAMLDQLLAPTDGSPYPDYWKATEALQKSIDMRDAILKQRDTTVNAQNLAKKEERDKFYAAQDAEMFAKLQAETDTSVDPLYWGAIAAMQKAVATRDAIFAQREADAQAASLDKLDTVKRPSTGGSTGSSPSYPGGSINPPQQVTHIHTWHVYGAERSFVMDIMREIDLISRENK